MNIIIIGASRGLGYELVKKFLSLGNTVCAGIAARIAPQSLLDLEEKFSGNLLIFRADVTDEEEIENGARLCFDKFGVADALINSAGVLLKGDRVNLLHNCDVAELRKTIDVNLVGPIIVIKHFYPIIKKGGRLLTITSEGTGLNNCGTWVPCYALSKTAATKVSGMMNKAVNDVDFYSVYPGRMNTEMGKTTAQIEAAESSNGIYSLITETTKLNRDEWYIDYLGEPMEL